MSDAVWFNARPLRSERCPRCRGLGEVDRAYALIGTPVPTPGAPLDAIHANVVGCFDIFTACQEAAEIAGRGSRPVAFDFNGRLVVVPPGGDPDAIARAWWFDEFGETPEQTAARR